MLTTILHHLFNSTLYMFVNTEDQNLQIFSVGLSFRWHVNQFSTIMNEFLYNVI